MKYLILLIFTVLSESEIYSQNRVLNYSNINLKFSNENNTGLARLETDFIYGLKIEVNTNSKPVFVGLYRTFQLEIMEKSDSFKLASIEGDSNEFMIFFNWLFCEDERNICKNVIKKVKFSIDTVVLFNLNGKNDTFLRKEIYFNAFNYRVTSSLRSPVIKIIGNYCSEIDTIKVLHNKILVEGNEYYNVKLFDTILNKYPKSRSFVFSIKEKKYVLYQEDNGKYSIIRISENALHVDTKYLFCLIR